MRNRLTCTFATLLTTTVMLVGCGSPEQTDTAIDPSQVQYVPLLQQEHGDNPSLTEPLVELVNSDEQLDEFGIDIPLAEQVDFDSQSLVVLAMGEQSTGGHWTRITGVQQVGNELWVVGVMNFPAEDAAVTQQITHPYAAAIIPKPGPDVQLRRQVERVTGRSPGEFDTDAPTGE